MGFTDHTIAKNSRSIMEYLDSTKYNFHYVYAIGKSFPIGPCDKTKLIANALALVVSIRG